MGQARVGANYANREEKNPPRFTKPFVLKEGSKEIAEFWNRNAAKIRMRELGGNCFVWSRLEGRIIFSPMDA